MLHMQETKIWRPENFCDHIIPNIWPPNSSDFTPFYYEWVNSAIEANDDFFKEI